MAASQRPAEILCVGFGALGVLYSWVLEQSGGARVTAVCRSNYDSVKEVGVDIISAKFGHHLGYKPYRVVKNAEEAKDRVYDFVLCTFKCIPDMCPTSEVIMPFLRRPESGEKSKLPAIVLIQNGIGIEDEPRQTLVDCIGPHAPKEGPLASTIISCVAWIGANLVNGGTRDEHGPLERLQMGLFPSPLRRGDAARSIEGGGSGPPTPTPVSSAEGEKLELFYALFRKGGGGAEREDDIQPMRWRKLLWNAAWGALATLARQPMSALLTDGTLHYSLGVVRRTMLEVLYVARACGLGEEVLPVAAVDESFNLTLSQFRAPHEVGEPTSAAESAAIKRSAEAAGQSSEHQPKEKTEEEKKEDSNRASFKPSLLLDLENNRPMELEPIIGAVVERARAKGVDTPRLDFILAALKPSQLAFISAARARTPASADTSNAELSAASHLAGRSNAFGPTPITTPHVEGMGVKGPWPAGAPVVENKTGYF